MRNIEKQFCGLLIIGILSAIFLGLLYTKTVTDYQLNRHIQYDGNNNKL